MSSAVANRVVMPRLSVRDERGWPRRRSLAKSSPSSDNPARTGRSVRYDVGENAHPKTHPDMDADRTRHGVANPEPLAPEATIELLALVRNGDRAALARLLERCIPALRRWARGRLPQWTRGVIETNDLVLDAVIAAMGRLDVFEARYQGALQEYLRMAVRNRITDVIRKHSRHPANVELPESLKDEGTSPLERVIGAENVARYDAALERLNPAEREAIVGRIEMQYSYEELMIVLGKPTPPAARMAVTRAMKRLAEEMRRDY
jgi:RNA polymerase sigma factor (sigma-70 family)